MQLEEQQLRKKIKTYLIVFIVFLVLIGITAFPLEWELSVLVKAAKHAPNFIQLY